jgi:predicted Zn-dependent protease
LDFGDDNTEFRTPVRIFITPLAAPDDAGLRECLALTSIHELGHAIGIFRHSPNATDIMFANPVVDLPSALDRGTIEVLYHVPPTLRLVRP